MTRINTLLREAKQKFVRKLKISIIFIRWCDDKKQFELECHLWDGINGSGGEYIYSYHDIKEDVEKEIDQFQQKYKWISKERPIIPIIFGDIAG